MAIGPGGLGRWLAASFPVWVEGRSVDPLTFQLRQWSPRVTFRRSHGQSQVTLDILALMVLLTIWASSSLLSSLVSIQNEINIPKAVTLDFSLLDPCTLPPQSPKRCWCLGGSPCSLLFPSCSCAIWFLLSHLMHRFLIFSAARPYSISLGGLRPLMSSSTTYTLVIPQWLFPVKASSLGFWSLCPNQAHAPRR